jgi:hypothetical protein
MPVHHEGPDAGQLVGWLSLNKLPVGAKAHARHWRARRAWRLAGKLAYQRARLPRGLDRVYVEVEFRFARRQRRLNPSNFELTVKPIIDALQPEVTGMRRNPKTKKLVPFVDYGWGVIPEDTQQHVVRGPEMAIGEPLGPKNPIKGMVILHIKPLPPEARP